MGICCSKKKEDKASNHASPFPIENPTSNDATKMQFKVANKEEKKIEVQSPREVLVEKPKKSISSSQDEKKEKPKKQELDVNITNVFIAASKPEETRIGTPVRTSSCTKEEVDAILIQCGRLSRSSSEKRKYSGSKRSFDFDNEKSKEEEEEYVQTVSRPSPRRRTPSRERSGSKERGSQRRVSRSPNRISESEKTKQQPTKMVSVPPREKGLSNENGVKKATTANTSVNVNKRNASPRSRSPANGTSRVSNENGIVPQASLSRSNSRKAEQSPSRRNPMSEIDENLIKGNSVSNGSKAMKSKEGEDCARKASQIQTQSNGIKSSNSNNTTTTTNNGMHDQLKSGRPKEKQQLEVEILEESKDPKVTSKATELETLTNRTITRTRSSRRSSKDFDNIIGGANATNYTSLLLEDIQQYHQQNTGFSLPACVSKACSILEAVADLNSSSSDQSYGKRGLNTVDPFVESEIVVKDDLMEPSLHKYISVRDIGKESEPQESAGSNSFVAQPWHSSLEHNSVDSTDRYWNSQSNNEEEEVEESSLVESREMKIKRGGSSSSILSATMSSTSKKRDVDYHRRGGVSVRKAYSVPVVAAAASS